MGAHGRLTLVRAVEVKPTRMKESTLYWTEKLWPYRHLEENAMGNRELFTLLTLCLRNLQHASPRLDENETPRGRQPKENVPRVLTYPSPDPSPPYGLNDPHIGAYEQLSTVSYDTLLLHIAALFVERARRWPQETAKPVGLTGAGRPPPTTFMPMPDREKPAAAACATVTLVTELCLRPSFVVLNVLPSSTLSLTGLHPGPDCLPATSQHNGTAIPVPLGKNPLSLSRAATAQDEQLLAVSDTILLLKLLKFRAIHCFRVPNALRLESRTPRPFRVV